MHVTPKRLLAGSLLALTLAFGACTGLKGTYAGTENAFLQKLTFRSGGKVDATFLGMTKEGTYKKDGKRVTIQIGDDTQVLTLASNGCLEGGGILGSYCKGGSAEKSAKSNGSGGGKPSGGGKLSGTWEASAPDGTEKVRLRLKFKSGGRVEFSMQGPGGDPEVMEADYELNGTRLTIRVPGGLPMQLVRNKNALEGDVMGEVIRFEKQ